MIIACENTECKKPLKIPDTAFGKKVRCPHCSAVFRAVPLDEEQAHAAVPIAGDVPTSGDNPTSGDDAPPQRDTTAENFIRDLDTVWIRLFRKTDPRACLNTLAQRFEDRKTHLARFRTQLAAIEPPDKRPRRYLRELAGRFAQGRATAEHRIETLLHSLHQDDPLKSGISLFGTMDVGRLERAHTKTLAWFLHPNREHDFGPVLLGKLLSILQFDLPADVDLTMVEAKAEQCLDTGKRLDVFARGRLPSNGAIQKSWYLIIEAKVDAAEGPDQTAEYDEWIKNNLGKSPVLRVFLTVDGRPPESTNEITWKPLSFLQLAFGFRQELENLRDRAGYHFLRHYLTGVLKDIYRWKLPIRNPRDCVDPYQFVDYLKTFPTTKTETQQ